MSARLRQPADQPAEETRAVCVSRNQATAIRSRRPHLPVLGSRRKARIRPRQRLLTVRPVLGSRRKARTRPRQHLLTVQRAHARNGSRLHRRRQSHRHRYRYHCHCLRPLHRSVNSGAERQHGGGAYIMYSSLSRSLE